MLNHLDYERLALDRQNDALADAARRRLLAQAKRRPPVRALPVSPARRALRALGTLLVAAGHLLQRSSAQLTPRAAPP